MEVCFTALRAESPSPSVDRVQHLLRPVSAEARGGADARLGDHFDRIQSEIAKLLQASNHGGDIDWRLVVDRSEALLVGEAKDLRAAVYLAAAWHRVEGLSGLQRGFDLLSGSARRLLGRGVPAAREGRPSRAEVAHLAHAIACASTSPATLARADAEQVRADVERVRWVSRGRARDFPIAARARARSSMCSRQLPADKRPAPERVERIRPRSSPLRRPMPRTRSCGRSREPIRAGEDPRLCDEFEQLRVEIAKVGAVAGVDAAWPNVAACRARSSQSAARTCAVSCSSRSPASHRGRAGSPMRVAGLAACTERYADACIRAAPKARSGALLVVWAASAGRGRSAAARHRRRRAHPRACRCRTGEAGARRAVRRHERSRAGRRGARADQAAWTCGPTGRARATTAPPKPRPIASADGATNDLAARRHAARRGACTRSHGPRRRDDDARCVDSGCG